MSVEIGRKAEQVAASYLLRHDYSIIQRNWRTRYCEIDIVAAHKGVIWFVEVKYRRQHTQGKGLDYITDKKQRQMYFAAEMWIKHFNWFGDYDIAALEVTGPYFEVTAFTSC